MKTILEYLINNHINNQAYTSDMPKEAVSKDETMKHMLHIQLELMAENPKFKEFYEGTFSSGCCFQLFKDYKTFEEAIKAINEKADIWKTVFQNNETPYNCIGVKPVAFSIEEYIYRSNVTKDDVNKAELTGKLQAAGLVTFGAGQSKLVNVLIRNLWDVDIAVQILKKMYPEK